MEKIIKIAQEAESFIAKAKAEGESIDFNKAFECEEGKPFFNENNELILENLPTGERNEDLVYLIDRVELGENKELVIAARKSDKQPFYMRYYDGDLYNDFYDDIVELSKSYVALDRKSSYHNSPKIKAGTLRTKNNDKGTTSHIKVNYEPYLNGLVLTNYRYIQSLPDGTSAVWEAKFEVIRKTELPEDKRYNVYNETFNFFIFGVKQPKSQTVVFRIGQDGQKYVQQITENRKKIYTRPYPQTFLPRSEWEKYNEALPFIKLTSGTIIKMLTEEQTIEKK